MKLRVVVGVAAAVFGFAQWASAGVVGGPTPEFSLVIGSETLTTTLTPNGDGTFSASGDHTVADSYSIIFDFTLDPDPVISGSFTLTNLAPGDQTFSVTATLGTGAVAGPTRMGGGFGQVTYTDQNDSTVGVGADPFYSARIDSIEVQALGSFLFNPISGGPGISLTQGAESFGAPIPSAVGPGVVGNIGVAFGFTLTGMDQLELEDFEFVVVPESSVLSLFVICLALILCRFARERTSSR